MGYQNDDKQTSRAPLAPGDAVQVRLSWSGLGRSRVPRHTYYRAHIVAVCNDVLRAEDA